MNNPIQPAYKVLRLPAVKEMTGLCRSSIYTRMTKKTFPQQFSLGGKAVGWNYSDIQDWIKQRIDTTRKVNTQ